MFSTLLELAGFGLIIAATAILGGLVPAFFVGGAVLLLVGYATDELALSGIFRRPRRAKRS